MVFYNQAIYHALKSVPEEERPDYLRMAGFKDEDIQDLLLNLFQPSAFPAMKPKENRMTDVFRRIEGMIERAKSKPNTLEEPKNEKEDRFQRDILVNQYLMGGSTEYDTASFNNPNFRKTQVTQWFYEIFRLSHYRAAMIIGGPGSGKTWGTLAYMNSLATARGCNRVEWSDSEFVTAFRLSEMFHNQKNQGKRYIDKMEEILKKKYLMIDDLGAEPAGFRGSDFVAYFDYLFSERHKFKRYTFITSNATRETIREVYGDRFISRFNDIGMLLETSDSDMRRANRKGSEDG